MTTESLCGHAAAVPRPMVRPVSRGRASAEGTLILKPTLTDLVDLMAFRGYCLTPARPLRLCLLVTPSSDVLRQSGLVAHAVLAPLGSRTLLAPLLGPRLPTFAPLLTSSSSAALLIVGVDEAYT